MKTKKLSIGRHRRACSMCAHPQCAEIEAAFVSWRSPGVIAKEFGLADRATVYRHAHALGLFEKRQRNVRSALEHIIEQAAEVEATASSVVAAIQAYAKLTPNGQWVDRTEQLNLNDLFERMTVTELDLYAREGTLPKWFQSTVGPQHQATVGDSDE
jgi:isopentenyldiphosphate isomerase